MADEIRICKLVLFISFVNFMVGVCTCGLVCKCDVSKKLVDCSNLRLKYIPVVPNGTESLLFDGNRIAVINGGTFSVFGSSLQELSLADNHLERISNGSFAGLGRLERLDLSGNRLSRPPVDALHGLSSLRKLDISRNQLEFLPTDSFRELSNLEELLLDQNFIRVVQEGAFFNLTSLRKLSIKYGGLTQVPDLHSLIALQVLDLSHNQIVHIDARDFVGNINLLEIDLSENQLQSLTYDVVAHLRRLEKLWLVGNSWWCDCHVKWMHDILSEIEPTGSEQYGSQGEGEEPQPSGSEQQPSLSDQEPSLTDQHQPPCTSVDYEQPQSSSELEPSFTHQQAPLWANDLREILCSRPPIYRGLYIYQMKKYELENQCPALDFALFLIISLSWLVVLGAALARLWYFRYQSIRSMSIRYRNRYSMHRPRKKKILGDDGRVLSMSNCPREISVFLRKPGHSYDDESEMATNDDSAESHSVELKVTLV